MTRSRNQSSKNTSPLLADAEGSKCDTTQWRPGLSPLELGELRRLVSKFREKYFLEAGAWLDRRYGQADTISRNLTRDQRAQRAQIEGSTEEPCTNNQMVADQDDNNYRTVKPFELMHQRLEAAAHDLYTAYPRWPDLDPKDDGLAYVTRWMLVSHLLFEPVTKPQRGDTPLTRFSLYSRDPRLCRIEDLQAERVPNRVFLVPKGDYSASTGQLDQFHDRGMACRNVLTKYEDWGERTAEILDWVRGELEGTDSRNTTPRELTDSEKRATYIDQTYPRLTRRQQAEEYRRLFHPESMSTKYFSRLVNTAKQKLDLGAPAPTLRDFPGLR